MFLVVMLMYTVLISKRGNKIEREANIMTILTEQTLDKQNLISFRKKLRATELQAHAEKMLAYVEQCGAVKVGGGISATYAIEGDVMDVEMYLPLDMEIPSTEEFVYKPWLFLDNCIATTHKGNPQLLESTMLQMNEYIEENGLTPISAGFIVTINEVTDMEDVDKFEVDVYISISPNVV